MELFIISLDLFVPILLRAITNTLEDFREDVQMVEGLEILALLA